MNHTTLIYNIEECEQNDGETIVKGWCFSTEGGLVSIKGQGLKTVENIDRTDVKKYYGGQCHDVKCGFYASFSQKSENIIITFADAQCQTAIDICEFFKKQRWKTRIGTWRNKINNLINKVSLIWHCISIGHLKKIYVFACRYGIVSALRLIYYKIRGMAGIDYQKWYEQHSPDKQALLEQKKHIFPYMPLISIVTPTFNTPAVFLQAMIESVQAQTYSHWELCIADGSTDPQVFAILEKYAAVDSRIKIKKINENKGIAGNSNEALALAVGEYIALLDHDDMLTPNALYEMAAAINAQQAPDVIYSDEDKTDANGGRFFAPNFKPDFSRDYLYSCNYICHLLLIKTVVLEKAGRFFDSRFDGAQDYDLILRCVEQSEHIYHIAKILYHWRVHKQSTAGGAGSKSYTHIAGKNAITEHLHRIKSLGKVLDDSQGNANLYRVVYPLEKQPLVSIIIPNYNHKNDLQKCINAVLEKTTYRNYEILVVENNSTEAEVFDYYKEIDQKNNIRVLYYEGSFNYARINNWAVRRSEGEYIVFMNNDIEIISNNWLEEMLMYNQREQTGIVGAKLYYPDNTIQHAGVIIGIGGVAGHAFKNFPKNDMGYISRLICIQDLSAVTAALMMMRKKVFDEVNGFDEGFAVAFNDVDLCLAVRQKNYAIVFNPYVEAYHYESKSRGNEDTLAKKRRFILEVNLIHKKWGSNLSDPFYNVNLTLDKEDFSLRSDSEEIMQENLENFREK